MYAHLGALDMDYLPEQEESPARRRAGRIFISVLLAAIVSVIAWSFYRAWERQARAARMIGESAMLREYVRGLRDYSGKHADEVIPTAALAAYGRQIPAKSSHSDPSWFFRKARVADKSFSEWKRAGATVQEARAAALSQPAPEVWEEFGQGLFLRDLKAVRDEYSATLIVALFFHERQMNPRFSAAFADEHVHWFDIDDVSEWEQAARSHADDATRLGLPPLPDIAGWLKQQSH